MILRMGTFLEKENKICCFSSAKKICPIFMYEEENEPVFYLPNVCFLHSRKIISKIFENKAYDCSFKQQ